MGLYSNTRLDSLNEYASEEFKRTENVESLIETCIEIRENDFKMFESLLNLDFAEASMLMESDSSNASDGFKTSAPRKITTKKEDEEARAEELYQQKMAQDDDDDNEVGPAEKKEEVKKANESKIKNIWNKIVEFFQKIIDKIKAFFNKVATKVGEIIRRDKAIVEKYKNAFTAENLNGYNGIADFSAPQKSPEDMQKWADMQTKEMSRTLDQVLSGIASASDKTSVNAKVDQFISKEDKNAEDSSTGLMSKEGVKNTFFKKYTGDTKFVPTVDFMKTALDSIGERSKVLDAIKKTNADFEKSLNAKKADLKAAYNKVKADSNSSELELAKASGSFKLAQGYSRKVIKIADSFVKMTTKAFGAYRKAVLIVGKYCLSNKKEEAAKESAAMDFAISEASDLYVAEALEF